MEFPRGARFTPPKRPARTSRSAVEDPNPSPEILQQYGIQQTRRRTEGPRVIGRDALAIFFPLRSACESRLIIVGVGNAFGLRGLTPALLRSRKALHQSDH